jgi:hypothetical protein
VTRAAAVHTTSGSSSAKRLQFSEAGHPRDFNARQVAYARRIKLQMLHENDVARRACTFVNNQIIT